MNNTSFDSTPLTFEENLNDPRAPTIRQPRPELEPKLKNPTHHPTHGNDLRIKPYTFER